MIAGIGFSRSSCCCIFSLRFVEDMVSSGDGIDRVARQVCGEYLRGMSWVIAYYTCGNNPVVTSQRSLAYEEDEVEQRSKKMADTNFKGQPYASWHWYVLQIVKRHFLKVDLTSNSAAEVFVDNRFYCYYYAPLAQDLAENAKHFGRCQQKALHWGPLHLDEYSNGDLRPKYGPVLPMIQLMSVIPPQR